MTRARLKDAVPPPPPAPVAVWLVTKTRTGDMYPCRCSRTRSCGAVCPCRGRVDVDFLPRYCCARTTKTASKGKRS